MKAGVLFLLILLSILFLEGSFTTLPVALIFLLLILVFTRKLSFVLTLALTSGIILDVVFVRPFFERSLFFVLFLLIIFLYERKFETKTLPFILFASFVGSFLYLVFFSYSDKLIQAFVATIIGSVIFIIFQKFDFKFS